MDKLERVARAIDPDAFDTAANCDCEDHEIQDVDDIFLSGAMWTEAPRELVEPFFLRDM